MGLVLLHWQNGFQNPKLWFLSFSGRPESLRKPSLGRHADPCSAHLLCGLVFSQNLLPAVGTRTIILRQV